MMFDPSRISDSSVSWQSSGSTSETMRVSTLSPNTVSTRFLPSSCQYVQPDTCGERLLTNATRIFCGAECRIWLNRPGFCPSLVITSEIGSSCARARNSLRSRFRLARISELTTKESLL